MLAAARRIDPELAEHAQRLGAGVCRRRSQDLLVDYTRLFLGPIAGAGQALCLGLAGAASPS